MENFSRKLIDWYRENGRDLPWRRTKNPYLIWISEIILQQTRVVQGYDYYQRFVARFPDVFALAAADEDEVMKYWQGLGYYSPTPFKARTPVYVTGNPPASAILLAAACKFLARE